MMLYENSKLNDIGVRLRFYSAYQLERSFSCLFPNICALPFGSSVNGFGKQDCDLDLFLTLDRSISVSNFYIIFYIYIIYMLLYWSYFAGKSFK